jgi:2',3'-cyclic-nucleotide 2'-phosphodiesterase (5'-nucleotidase family)
MNNGGLRGNLPAGDVTYGLVFAVSPFGNLIERLTVRGADLRAYLERIAGDEIPDVHVSGVRLVVAPARPAGSRLMSIVLDGGRPLDDAATYTLAVNDYMTTQPAARRLLERALRRDVGDVTDHAALAAWLRTQRSPVRADDEARIVVATP